MRFAIKDRVYDASSIDDVSLRDILLFERQTEVMGQRVTWPEVEQWTNEITALKTEREKEQHPKAIWLFAVTIWATRRNLGEDVDFDQAVSIQLKDLKVLPEPQDHQASPDPHKAARTGSGRAAARRPAKRPAKKTSAPR